MNLVAIVGVVLVLAGLVALFWKRGSESDTTLNFGSLKLTTRSPAIVLIALGVVCVGWKIVEEPSIPEDAEKSYLAMVAAYNAGDSAAYYSHFAEPMSCFYSAAGVRIREQRAKLDSFLQVTASDLSVLDAEEERVEFCDRGQWRTNGRMLQHHKIVVMRKRDGKWLVDTETTANQPECYKSAFASKC